ncbi:MAG: hypothetical protein QME47_00720, partial [Candidatus Thermoplasmatota archaeon]|nr:hypothetical protein [Candidatus Thermoplasmatota archaeon]
MKSITLAISILAGILVLSAIVVLAGNAGVATVSETKSESIGKGIASHAPIYINGNSQFTSANGVTSGSGTESDPYI